MRKRIYGVLAVLLVAVMFLAACKPAAETPPPAEPTASVVEQATVPPGFDWEAVDPSGQEVIFWHQHSKERETALMEIVDEFNTTNEYGITVVAEYQGSYGDIFNKMLGVLNSPDAPDLVVAYQNQAATYQLSDALFDMNQLLDSPKWGISKEDQADFFPGFFAQDVFPNFENKRLGFPPNRSMEVMYYNMDWLKELGFDAAPTTPEQFKEMACKAAEQPFSKATVDGANGYELSIDASRWASWTFAFGGDIYDYNAAQYTYDSEGSKQAMAFIKDLIDNGCAKQVTEAYGDQTDFGNGSLLFSVGSSSGLPYYGKAVDEGAQFEWSVAAIPHTTPDPVMNVYGASVSIPLTTPERELAAWLFVKYYTTPEVQAKWATVSQYFPVRQSVVDGLGDLFATVPGYQTAFEMLKYSHFEPPVPGYDFVRNAVSEAMAAIVDGAEVDATVSALNTDANEQLAEQLSQSSAPPPPPPTPVPTEIVYETCGTADKPCVITFVPSAEVGKITTAGQGIADWLAAETGLNYQIEVGTSFAASIEAMGAKKAQIGFLNTFSVLLADAKYGIDPALATVRKLAVNELSPDKDLEGTLQPYYRGQFLTQADSGITTIADLKGKTFCFVDPNSTSGYIIPNIVLKANGIDAEAGDLTATFAGSHPNVGVAVYKGDCDAGVTYIDIRTDGAAKLYETYPDIMEKVVVFYTTDPIPNDGIQFIPNFDPALRAQIVAAFLKLSEDEAGKQLLKDLYSINGLVEIQPDFYDAFAKTMIDAGVDPATLVK